MLFPRSEDFFSRPQRSSLSTTSTSLPKPALSYQNLLPQACQNQPYRIKTLYSFVKTQLLTLVGVEMWTENGLRESARPCSFPVLRVFFKVSHKIYTLPYPSPLTKHRDPGGIPAWASEFQPARPLSLNIDTRRTSSLGISPHTT